MPEQLTKHPEVTLQVLRSSPGVRCGDGAPQAILTQCPASRFCQLPGGELCVFGLPEAARMTQVSAAEWRAVLAQFAAAPAAPPPSAPPPATAAGAEVWLAAGAGLLVGAAAGAFLARGRARTMRGP